MRLATIVADIADHLPKDGPSKGEAGHHCSGYSGASILAKVRQATIVCLQISQSPLTSGFYLLISSTPLTSVVNTLISTSLLTSVFCPLLSTSPMTSAFNPSVFYNHDLYMFFHHCSCAQPRLRRDDPQKVEPQPKKEKVHDEMLLFLQLKLVSRSHLLRMDCVFFLQ